MDGMEITYYRCTL